MSFFGFHPVIADWFHSQFEAPTEPQQRGWPSIAAGEHTLIAAPTGSGKTLTAFLACIDRLLKESLEHGLNDEVRVVYVSPLRALSNDMHRNLEVPLQEIGELTGARRRSPDLAETADRRSPDLPVVAQSGDLRSEEVRGPETRAQRGELATAAFPDYVPIRAGLRTGDTTSSQRAALVRRPPHILVTTPESLYLMVTAGRSRETLRNVDTIIVDEIHALVRDKRGSHLSLTLERLEALTSKRLQRIGLSATQKPIEQTAAFLVGRQQPDGVWLGSTNGSPQSNALGAALRSDPSHPTASHEQPTRPHSSFPQNDEANPQSAIRNPQSPTIVNVGHQRDLDLAIETPASELSAVCSHEQWAEVNERLVELIREHHSTLIFVNTRRLAERLTHQLTELLGEDAVSSHHGSLAADMRLTTERRLKSGELKAVVATASLELGIDVGYIDLVVQIGSPRAIATFLQRIGRSGHSLGLTPKGRLFALTRDELIECMALIRAVKAGRLDVVKMPSAPLDVLAQQIVAEISAEEWDTDELFALCRRAYSYRDLKREDFDRVVEYLSDGITKASGRSRVYLHHDHVGKRLRTRKGARIAAASNAGAIPEIAQFRVVAEPEHTVVGSLDEDFAVESMAGDVFLLGNTSWRILHVRGSDVTVYDAEGAPPTIPFWRGEAPGRTVELSEEVSRLRRELEERLSQVAVGRIANPSVDGAVYANEAISSENPTASDTEYTVLSTEYLVPGRESVDDHDVQRPDGLAIRPTEAIARWLAEETNASLEDAKQAVEYAAAQKAAIGLLPTQDRIVFERFFDETGGMQLVVHAPFGGQINRGWGLAMRKRFCRSYDFELQATADDNGFILTLGPQHSFPIESLFPMLTRHNARQLLEQAVLAVPMFELRWRWNVTRSLLVLRRQNGKKVPPALQRFRADDLLTAVFPRLTGCQEEHTGDVPIPDHPLVQQTMEDCLFEAVDIEGLNEVLGRIESEEITLVARDTREPSPFAYELLNANPYAFLDGGEIQERRTRAVSTRRTLTVESVDDLGRLDPLAIEQVIAEAQPAVRDADELHDLLLSRILLPVDEVVGQAFQPAGTGRQECLRTWFRALAEQNRAAEIVLPDGRRAWVSAERWPAVAAVFPEAAPEPAIEVPATVRQKWPSAEARVAMIRGLIETSGPITIAEVAHRLCVTESQAEVSLEALEGEGVVLRGRFSPALNEQQSREWANGGREFSEGRDRAANSGDSRPPLATGIEWCHRRLLARIHRLTLQGLRRQIEPVSVDVFQRFLFRHHGLTGPRKRSGANGLFDVLAMLQGLDVPAVAWERDVLPARVEQYEPALLDELCLAGEVGWGRLNPAKRDPERGRPMASLTRVAPISLFLREDADWLFETAGEFDLQSLSTPARQIFDLLSQRGATFAADLLGETQMLPTQLNDALGELVTRGAVTADGFGGLRRLIREPGNGESSRRSRSRGLARRRATGSTVGRWAVGGSRAKGPGPRDDSDGDVPGPSTLNPQPSTEQWAWQLLRRWGVVFRDLLARETCAPRWWELLQVYRRLEARGEIRGGRFVTGVAGEQFAVGDTIRQLRKLRDEPPREEVVTVSAADPLNLVGILTEHPRVPSTASNKVAYLNGRPAARLQAGALEIFETLTEPRRAMLAQHLRGRVASDLPQETTGTGDSATGESPRRSRRRERRREPNYPNKIPRPMY